MRQLFSREIRNGFLQEAMIRVREEQLHRGPGGFFLAMRMVEQHLVEVIFGSGQPFGIGRGGQMQHSVGSLHGSGTAAAIGADSRPIVRQI